MNARAQLFSFTNTFFFLHYKTQKPLFATNVLLKITAMNCQTVQRLINTDSERKYGKAVMSY